MEKGDRQMKRYLVFAYDQFYPSGGWNDFVGAFDTLEEAESKGRETLADNEAYDIVDLEKLEMISGGGRPPKSYEWPKSTLVK